MITIIIILYPGSIGPGVKTIIINIIINIINIM